MVAGHVGQHSITQQLPHVFFVRVGPGPGRGGELAQGTLSQDFFFT